VSTLLSGSFDYDFTPMPTLDVLENGMVGVHSTMSSIHEMSSIPAQYQLQE
jgi:hypothetical protein